MNIEIDEENVSRLEWLAKEWYSIPDDPQRQMTPAQVVNSMIAKKFESTQPPPDSGYDI